MHGELGQLLLHLVEVSSLGRRRRDEPTDVAEVADETTSPASSGPTNPVASRTRSFACSAYSSASDIPFTHPYDAADATAG
jgi:hypothetical protein